jgi:hypothetical protein
MVMFTWGTGLAIPLKPVIFSKFLQLQYYFFGGACRSEILYYFYDLLLSHDMTPSLDNNTPKLLLRVDAVWHSWEVWIGGCVQRYVLVHEPNNDPKLTSAILDSNDIKITSRYIRLSRSLEKIVGSFG